MTNSSLPRPLKDQSADAKGDFFFDELMTPQPDATQAFLRARLEALREIEAKQKAEDEKAKVEKG